ncbi:hypothetical protein [Williamwhitmania taraxaci]|uniref:Uncharacterized protein n=1 Tax=Williamwhitmania taraxaci TaxID=1640674 RepID=A0A1G6NVY0_9BACT|nr:hypothetical protein [Williamwhitmania taraxaci]SDC71949.1 hypothetical protein SAMN05216323_104613 [Williamwhitmania taraxaci]
MENKYTIVEENPSLFWTETAEAIGGVFTTRMQEQRFGDYYFDLHLLQISKPHRGLIIELNSCFLIAPNILNEYHLDDLRIESFIPDQVSFFLHYFPKGVYDKIFWHNKPHSGFKDFDKVIGFETNRLWELRKFFANNAVRDLIQNDFYSRFNVRYENEMLIVKNQSTQLILNKEILLAEYQKFVLFIDGLIDAKLIKL